MHTILPFIRKKYSYLKIKDKLFYLISGITFIVFIITLIVVLLTYTLLKEQHQEVSAQVLNSSSSLIGNELDKIEKMSLQIAVEPTVQEYLLEIEQSEPENSFFVNRTAVEETLFGYDILENYIDSIHIIDTHTNEIITGKRHISIDHDQKDRLIEMVKNKNGRNIWVQDENEKWVLCVRAIREVNKLKLSHLGAIVIRINKQQLMKKYTNILLEPNTNILVLYKDQVVFSTLSIDPIYPNLDLAKDKSGYFMQTVDKKKYFIAYTKVDFTDWVYLNVIPYSNISQRISYLKLITVIVYGIILIITFILSKKFTTQFTKPIERLVLNMNTVEKGIFDISKMHFEDIKSNDEIACLQRDFEIMMQKINHLINENYKKQLTIQDSKYRALQAQVNPHFLYNTLTSINSLAKISKQKQISMMVEALGNLLRSSVNNDRPLITIEEEIKILQNYMVIQNIRYKSRLDFEMNIPEELWHYDIPGFTLQPLVENSIKYGLSTKRTTGIIKVIGITVEENIEINVEDNGIGMDPDYLSKLENMHIEPSGTGIGIKNIHDRIQLMFGQEYGITIESQKGLGTIIRILIPRVAS